MIMEAREKRLSTPLAWGRREKTAVGTLLAVVLVAVLALGVYAATSGKPARKDCIDVTFPSTLGGAELKGCGSQAKEICASGASGSFHKLRQELSESCRRAGFPF
jgi:cobalamin biosynthesis protein CobD/CbiB